MKLNKKDVIKILVVSGGTGGHIFPAAVFGRWAENFMRADVSYLTGSRPLEQDIYNSLGIKPHRLSLLGSPLGSPSLLENFKRLWGLLCSFAESYRVLKKERPDACFLFGGYVSFTPLLMCLLKRIPVVFHEQNAAAGRVTRIASMLGAKIVSGWPDCEGISQGDFYPAGVPVRPVDRLSRVEAVQVLKLDLPLNARVIGVAGGSLGSDFLLKKMIEAAKIFHDRDKDVCFVVLGESPGDVVSPNVKFIGRHWNTAPFYSLCDAVICRAGASTLAELLAWGIPALVVPWLGASESHQEKNAISFLSLSDSLMWSEAGVIEFSEVLNELLQKNPISKTVEFGKNACMSLWQTCFRKDTEDERA